MSSFQNKLFVNLRIIGSEPSIKHGWLVIEGNRILSFGEGQTKANVMNENIEVIDCEGLTLLPGFIDQHTHGAMGADFTFSSQSEINKISAFYASCGVSGFLASTYSANPQELATAISTIKACMGSEPGAVILGIHLEGPWINPSRAGAQDANTIRPASSEEVIPYLDSELIRMITLAPEIKENHWLIRACRDKGIAVSAGHTDATYDEIQEAVQMGITQVTHCFNAMRPFHHREPGAVGASLILPELSCELIADNIHVHPAVMRLLLKAKSSQNVILITDSIAAAGMPDGCSYFLGEQPVVCASGTVQLADGTLAGSMLTMDAALRNFINATGSSLEEIWRCTSLNSAEAIHVATHKGRIAAGYDADLVLMDSNLHVKLTTSEGRIIFDDR